MGGMFVCKCCHEQLHSDNGYKVCEVCNGEACDDCMCEDVGISERCCECFEKVAPEPSDEDLEKMRGELNHAALQFLNDIGGD